MWWAAIVQGALDTLHGVANWYATGQQAEMTRQQADLNEKAVWEQDRRSRLEQKWKLGEAANRAYASGLDVEGSSLQSYLSAMSDEMRRQADWQKDAGMKQVESQRQAADTMDTLKWFGIANDMGSSFFEYASSQNWWQGGGEKTATEKTSGFGDLGSNVG